MQIPAECNAFAGITSILVKKLLDNVHFNIPINLTAAKLITYDNDT